MRCYGNMRILINIHLDDLVFAELFVSIKFCISTLAHPNHWPHIIIGHIIFKKEPVI